MYVDAEVIVVGYEGLIFSFTSKMDAKVSFTPKKPHVFHGGCVHVEWREEGFSSGNVYNCTNLPAVGKGNGFLCELHQTRVFPSYSLSQDELRRVNYKGTVEEQIILKDARQIEKDIEAGLIKRPRYGRKLEDEPVSFDEWFLTADEPAEDF